MADLSENKYAWTEVLLPVGSLSSNKELFIHVDCYTASFKQQAVVKIGREDDTMNETIFHFGPDNGIPYKEYGFETFTLAKNTNYIVKVGISNDAGKGDWRPSNIASKSYGYFANYNLATVISEDHEKYRDDVNDSIIRLVWFSKPD